ncbi:MAG TPA: molybdenum cofactor biosynthesis protein MoaE [Aliiroseovarius sp.]|nr:molybdenum cofactor biosynthesis protein MoaE [Aliiroseovarius sp.]
MLRVQEAAFDPGATLNEFTANSGAAGAVVSFTGVVRDDTGSLDYMEIEHYPGMTEKAIGAMMQTATERWQLTACHVIHRHGQLEPGEVIMMVATASLHRVAAFEAAEYLMDYLKSRAPFWKKEVSTDGESWVESKAQDEAALTRW